MAYKMESCVRSLHILRGPLLCLSFALVQPRVQIHSIIPLLLVML